MSGSSRSDCHKPPDNKYVLHSGPKQHRFAERLLFKLLCSVSPLIGHLTYRQVRLDPDREVDFKLIHDGCHCKAKLSLCADLDAEIAGRDPTEMSAQLDVVFAVYQHVHTTSELSSH